MNPGTDYMPQLLQTLQAPGLAPADAVRLLADAADAHPADARPLLLLAAEFMQQGDADRAEAVYTTAVQRAPGFAIARFQLGLLQFTSGRPVMALSTWAALDELPEGDCLRLFKQAFEHLARDEFDDARALILRGMAANTTNAPLNRDMQMLLDRIAPASVPAPASHDKDKPAEEEAHFLLSAYQNRH
jgi:tetratricopeptide (TPR) repeat protein